MVSLWWLGVPMRRVVTIILAELLLCAVAIAALSTFFIVTSRPKRFGPLPLLVVIAGWVWTAFLAARIVKVLTQEALSGRRVVPVAASVAVTILPVYWTIFILINNLGS